MTEGAGIEKEFKRRTKTQTVLPSAETAAMLFWALLASGPAANASRFRETTMRKVDGRQTLGERSPLPLPLTSLPDPTNPQPAGDTPPSQFPRKPRLRHAKLMSAYE